MDEIKKRRSSKARTATRRVKDLKNAVRDDVSKEGIQEKVSSVKYTLEELGSLQDDLLDAIGDDEDKRDEVERAMQWYEKYEREINQTVTMARNHISSIDAEHASPSKSYVKIKKLTIPVFEGDPRNYLKWKGTFSRYTDGLNNDIKYDYLIANTKGRAQEYVSN